ncbi:MAG: fumarylacetoacetate hydrolase family protein [Myxococcales bacterium]|nr:fumarylacetoacetate hydrolase family protein [Myxococcales bacterium]
MKLVSYGPAGRELPGVLLDDGQIFCLFSASNGNIRSIRGLLQGGPEALEQVYHWLTSPDPAFVIEGSQVRLGPPITNPGKIVCLGLNYRGHAEEQNKPIPTHPLLFSKAATTLAGPQDPIWYPIAEENLDYEVEMVIVFGKPAFRVAPEDWQQYIVGYTIMNDISARDTQRADNKWFRGKSFDSCCPMGPYIVTADEVEAPQSLRLQAFVNDELRQDGNTNDLIFDLGQIVAFCTQNATFHPGDIIATGTPSGVGIHRKPPACLHVGDTVTVKVEQLGHLTNQVIERPAGALSPYPQMLG